MHYRERNYYQETKRWQWRVTASPAVISSCPHRITCPINVFPSSSCDDPLASKCSTPRLRSITWEEHIPVPFPPLNKSYLDHTRSKHGNPSFLIHSCSDSPFSLILPRILPFPGRTFWESRGKSLRSSDSPGQTKKIQFEKKSKIQWGKKKIKLLNK